MDSFTERVEGVIAEFPFHEFDSTEDVVADSAVARETWVSDLASNIVASALPVAIDGAEDKIDMIVTKHAQQHGGTIREQKALADALKLHLREVLQEAIAAGVIADLEY